jgi:ribosomal protein S18 acetylase RimI-like enzyme
MIRKINENDISKIIELHLNSFTKDHFSTAFSIDLLQKYFSKMIACNEYCSVCYDNSEEELLGYVIAGFNTGKAVSDFTKENKSALMITLLKNPRFLLEKLNTLLYKLVNKNKEKINCRLFLIAVCKHYKGEGIGRKMIAYFEDQLRNSNVKEYGLSVRKENVRAIKFYNNGGYVVESESPKSISYKKEI